MYVDDLVITSSEPSLIEHIIQELNCKFSTKDLDSLNYFCGMEALPTLIGLLLMQQKYVVYLLSKHNMLDSKLVMTPLVVSSPLFVHDGFSMTDARRFRQVLGILQHL